MNSKLEELDALLKNHTQSTQSVSDYQDALDFADFLRAAIDRELAGGECTSHTL